MIPVTQQAEPPGFDANVRRRGGAFLAINPTPSAKEFQSHSYWKWASDELYEAYKHVCAYSCMYIPKTGVSVDHFLPKSRRPDQAYEWNNYRLARHRLNLNKGDNLDVIDPFEVELGWFVVDFPSCLVRAADVLAEEIKSKVEKTIKTLKLNEDDNLVQERCDFMVDFAYGDISFNYLQRKCPFLAAEIARQGIQQTVPNIFKKPV